MNLTYSAADDAFRTQLRAWLDDALPTDWRDGSAFRGKSEAEVFALCREWETAKAKAGWCGIDWPLEYGGRGGSSIQRAIYDEELARARAPRSVNLLGLTLLAPTVMAFGTESQKKDILEPILFNEQIWCQGFSEPGAGSDLAALSCRAEDHGDHWLVNGQKLWTTNAVHADRMFALCRTDPSATRHAGLSMLLIDLRTDGVLVRPIRQLTGASEFGEVFFTDVQVPKENVLGPIGAGWNVAMTLLSFERGASAIGRYTTYRAELEMIARLANSRERLGVPAWHDPSVRQRLGAALVDIELLRLHSLHVLTKLERGAELGVESSLTKLHWSEVHQDLADLFMDVTELDGQRVDGALSPMQDAALRARSETIWGGSSQVQRTIVAERALGLPR